NPRIPEANDIVVRKRKTVEEGGKKKPVEFDSKQEWDQAVQGVLKPITDAQLLDAVDRGDKRSKHFEDLSGPKERIYRTIEGLLGQELVLGGEFERGTRQGDMAAMKQLSQSAEELNRTAKQLSNSFAIAQLDYNFRRYEREARYNQGIAILYELRVN